MNTFIFIMLFMRPLFLHSQPSLAGTWKGHYPGIIARLKGDTEKYASSADSIIVTYVFRQDLTGYVQTKDYTSAGKETSKANFNYKVFSHNYISMIFLKPSRQSSIKKREFHLLNGHEGLLSRLNHQRRPTKSAETLIAAGGCIAD